MKVLQKNNVCSFFCDKLIISQNIFSSKNIYGFKYTQSDARIIYWF